MKVLILYNPNSTGDGKKRGTRLRQSLKRADTATQLDITLQPTKHAGHAEEIAEALAKSGEQCVLISASGDGGYHEVVNGALAHKNSRVIVGLLPAGNANDHYHSTPGDDTSIVENILQQSFRAIDVLQVNATVEGAPWSRYAHSYAGIGVVARAAKDLTDKRPNVASEKWIVLHSLLSFRYVKIRESGNIHHYSSLIFSNISTMSKVLQLSGDTSLTDGRFEINRIRFRSKLRLILYLLTAATVGLTPTESVRRTTFSTTRPTDLQLDGEVFSIDADSDVAITSERKRLRCVW